MKSEIKKLFEGKPSQFFDAVRAQLEEKVATVIPYEAEELAESVFTENWKTNYKQPEAVQPKNTGNWKDKYKQPGETEENYQRRMSQRAAMKEEKTLLETITDRGGSYAFGFSDKDRATHKPLGSFTEKDHGHHFEYSGHDDAWAKKHGLQHRIKVGNRAGTHSEYRYGNVKGTRAHIASDENDDGTPKMETWHFKKHNRYTNEEVEPLEELSKETLGRYVKKAKFDKDVADIAQNHLSGEVKNSRNDRERAETESELKNYKHKFWNRKTGIKLANKKRLK
jgi:hypothetical protein